MARTKKVGVTQQIIKKTEYIDTECYKITKNGTYVTEDLDTLPEELSIFTLPITATFTAKINVKHIYYFFPLHPDNIVLIKSKKGIRTLNPTIKMLNENNKVSNFMNQITIKMMINTDASGTHKKEVDIKLFNNNSIQITGLQSTFQCNYAINKLAFLLSGEYITRYRYDMYYGKQVIRTDNIVGMGKLLRFKFIETDENELYITVPKISIINLTFSYGAQINQAQLYYKMNELKIQKKIQDDVIISYQTDIVAPVQIWLPYNESNFLTIFVFETGVISIMACKTREHVIKAYEFIKKILTENHDYIVKKDLISIIKNDSDLIKYINIKALEKLKT